MDADPRLADKLLAERFGPVTRQYTAGFEPVRAADDVGDGGPDTDLACARRRRDLNDALGAPRVRSMRAKRSRRAS